MENHTHVPQINFSIVLNNVIVNHFTVDEIRKSSDILEAWNELFVSKIKIDEFDCAQIIIFLHHDILRFDLSDMGIIVLKMFQCRKDFVHNELSSLFGEDSFLLDNVIDEGSDFTVLHYEVASIFVLPDLL